MTELEKTAKKVIDGDFDAQLELLLAFAELGYSITIRKFEEEKKMLNVDKYLEAIMSKGADRLDCHIAALRGVGTVACAHKLCKMCMQESFRWLFSEYEPPLLKNGDGLKPGDWIMVRNDDDPWEKWQFLAYLDGLFYARKIPTDGWTERVDYWSQARLPEEGE